MEEESRFLGNFEGTGSSCLQEASWKRKKILVRVNKDQKATTFRYNRRRINKRRLKAVIMATSIWSGQYECGAVPCKEKVIEQDLKFW